MTEDIQQLRTSAETAKIAAETAAKAAEKAATVASAASSNAAAVNVNIEYIKKDITEIKDTLKTQTSCFITISQHKELADVSNDHEARIRSNETFISTLQGKMWGIAITIGSIMTVVTLAIEYFIRK